MGPRRARSAVPPVAVRAASVTSLEAFLLREPGGTLDPAPSCLVPHAAALEEAALPASGEELGGVEASLDAHDRRGKGPCKAQPQESVAERKGEHSTEDPQITQGSRGAVQKEQAVEGGDPHWDVTDAPDGTEYKKRIPSDYNRGSQLGSRTADREGLSYETSEDEDPDPGLPLTTTAWERFISLLPSKKDFQSLISEVRDTCRSEISCVRQDLQHLCGRIDVLEEDHNVTRTHVAELKQLLTTQQNDMRDLALHVEDLDNRGRRCNIRVRGVPEADEPEDPKQILQTIFNSILGDSPTSVIKMDRAHRALQPKGSASRPRDIICCLHDFEIKEKIMRQARLLKTIKYKNTDIQLFPDLSRLTLQKRRHLRPLLQVLQDLKIFYRWGFPFSLTARREGISATLRSAGDIHSFCETLDIPAPKIVDWDSCRPSEMPPLQWTKKRGRSGKGRRGEVPAGAPKSPRPR